MSQIAAYGAQSFAGPRGFSANRPNPAVQVVLMAASALFAGLTPRECTEILSRARIKTFARDEILFAQGQPINSLVLIQAGSVKLTQLSSGGNEVILWMNGSGDVVSVHGHRIGCGHTCSARAMEQCQTLVWEYSRLQLLVVQYPLIGANIGKILASRLKELEERFREIATEKVSKRLALTLLRLIKSVGKEQREGVEVALSREELAQMTGTTLFTISRIISKWAELGLVVPKRQGVVICDPAALKTATELDD
jgi:CRP/FNR family transcriptional regulator, nitrogen oxide reductase regulator